jgi:hypothetical protein
MWTAIAGPILSSSQTRENQKSASLLSEIALVFVGNREDEFQGAGSASFLRHNFGCVFLIKRLHSRMSLAMMVFAMARSICPEQDAERSLQRIFSSSDTA